MDFANLKLAVLRLMQAQVDEESTDVVAGVTYDALLLKDACHEALKAICSRVWKQSVIEVDPAETEVELPEDCIEVEGILDVTEAYYLPKIGLRGDTSLGSSANAWTTYPQGSVVFSNPIGAEGATLYYSATWDLPEDEDDAITAPIWTYAAIKFYAAYYCLTSNAVQEALLAGTKTKVDSGTPSDNGSQKMAEWLYKRYETELARCPQTTKGIN